MSQNKDAVACIRREAINAGLCYMLDIEYQSQGNGVNSAEANAVLKGLLKELELPPITQDEVKDYISKNGYIRDMLVEFDKTVENLLSEGLLNKMWVA